MKVLYIKHESLLMQHFTSDDGLIDALPVNVVLLTKDFTIEDSRIHWEKHSEIVFLSFQ